MDALSPLVASAPLAVSPRLEAVRTRLSRGLHSAHPFFTSEPEIQENRLKEWLDGQGGSEAVLTSAEKRKALRSMLTAEGKKLLLDSAPEVGVFTSLEHPVLRQLWKNEIGADTTDVSTGTFFKVLQDYFAGYEVPAGSGCCPFQTTAARLTDAACKKIGSFIDLDLDGRITIAECNRTFLPPHVSLEDHISRYLQSSFPGNLENPLDSEYVPRVKEEAAVQALFAMGDTASVQLNGSAGGGKSALSAAVGYALLQGGKFPGGAYFVDCCGRPNAAGVLFAIVDVLSLPDHIKETADILVYLNRRVERLGPTLLLLDGLDDATAELEEKETVVQMIQEICSSRGGNVKVIATLRSPLPAVPGLKSVVIDAPDLGDARGLLELLLPLASSSAITVMLGKVQGPRVTCTDLMLLQKMHREREAAKRWTAAERESSMQLEKPSLIS